MEDRKVPWLSLDAPVCDGGQQAQQPKTVAGEGTKKKNPQQ